jgi:hypothetical protein
MSLEVGDSDQHISHIDIAGYGNRLEERFINLYMNGAVSPKAIGNEDGRIDDRIGKPVLIGGGEMRDGLLPRAPIEGVRIRQERFPFVLLDAFDNPSQKDGTDKSTISFFPKMEFYGDEIVLADLSFQIGSIQEETQFIEDGPSARTQVSKIDFASHLLPSARGILRKLRRSVNEGSEESALGKCKKRRPALTFKDGWVSEAFECGSF